MTREITGIGDYPLCYWYLLPSYTVHTVLLSQLVDHYQYPRRFLPDFLEILEGMFLSTACIVMDVTDFI